MLEQLRRAGAPATTNRRSDAIPGTHVCLAAQSRWSAMTCHPQHLPWSSPQSTPPMAFTPGLATRAADRWQEALP